MSSHYDDSSTPALPFSDAAEVPVGITKLVAIFEEELSSVSFPDVSLEALHTAGREISARAEQVAEARARLEAARQELAQSRDALLQLAERALAYAKVFSSGDKPLSARLEALSLGDAPRRKRRKVAEPTSKASKRSSTEAPRDTAEARPSPQLVAVG